MNWREVEAEPHDLDAIGGRDAELHELVAHLLRDRDEALGAAREHALDPGVETRLHRQEVAAQGVAVEGVDEDRAPRDEERRQAPERSALRRVRVDDVRTLRPHGAHEREQRAQVVEARACGAATRSAAAARRGARRGSPCSPRRAPRGRARASSRTPCRRADG